MSHKFSMIRTLHHPRFHFKTNVFKCALKVIDTSNDLFTLIMTRKRNLAEKVLLKIAIEEVHPSVTASISLEKFQSTSITCSLTLNVEQASESLPKSRFNLLSTHTCRH